MVRAWLLLGTVVMTPACGTSDTREREQAFVKPVPVTMQARTPSPSKGVRAYIERVACPCGTKHGVAHIVYADGRDERIRERKLAFEARVAEDHETVGILVGEHLDDPITAGDPLVIPNALVLVRNGRRVRTVDVGPVNRAWMFLEKGREVAYYTGGLHFAGSYLRVDVKTGKMLEFLGDEDRAEERPVPGWVNALSPP
jgi:hypothetical protein